MRSNIILSLLLLFFYDANVFSKQINYIKEPAQMRINPMNRPLLVEDKHLTPRVRPSDITAPAHLSVLRGQCFTKVIAEYRYNLCPFQNATQYEQSFKWNPYSGIIGIWKEWLIHGNEFKEMMMPDGDDCGSKKRQTRVVFTCSQEDPSVDAKIVSVVESATCEYLVTVATHLTCFNHSLKVYPFLPPSLQEQWDELEWRYRDGEVTEMGYKTFLLELLTEAGFLLSATEEELRWIASSPTQGATETPTLVDRHGINADSGQFTTLNTCNEEYSKLSEELELLKRELDQLKNITYPTMTDNQQHHNNRTEPQLISFL